MLTVAPTCEQLYVLGGLGLAISGEPIILEAIESRLCALRVPSFDSGIADVLRFEYQSGGCPNVERPEEPLRSVYEPADGEVMYAPRSDRLYLALGDGVRAVCDPQDGLTRVWTTDALPNLWLLSHPILTLPLMEQLKRRGLFSLHAAGFARDGRALLLPGTSGAGKTTLSIALARAGFDFLGDDTLFLTTDTAGVCVNAFPDEVDVTAATAGLFDQLAAVTSHPRREGWPKWALRAEQVFDTRIGWTCAPAALVFPRIGAADTSGIEPMRADEALMELLPNVMLTEATTCQRHVSTLARLAHETPCYRLSTGRDFDVVAQRLGALLE